MDVSVGYSWIRRRDLVSDDGLTAVLPWSRCLLRSCHVVVGVDLWFGWVEFIVGLVGRMETALRSDHEETHGREPFRGPSQPALSLQDSHGTRKSGFLWA